MEGKSKVSSIWGLSWKLNIQKMSTWIAWCKACISKHLSHHHLLWDVEIYGFCARVLGKTLWRWWFTLERCSKPYDVYIILIDVQLQEGFPLSKICMTKEIIYKSTANSWTEQLPHTLALPQQNLMLDLEWKKISSRFQKEPSILNPSPPTHTKRASSSCHPGQGSPHNCSINQLGFVIFNLIYS